MPEKQRKRTFSLTSVGNCRGVMVFAETVCPNWDCTAELVVDSLPDLAETAEWIWICWLCRYSSVCLYLSKMFSATKAAVGGMRAAVACVIALSRADAHAVDSRELCAFSLNADLELPDLHTFRTFSRKSTSSPTCNSVRIHWLRSR